MWYDVRMTQSEIQTRLKTLEGALDTLEKDAKEAIVAAVDAIAKEQVEEIRAKIAVIPESERVV